MQSGNFNQPQLSEHLDTRALGKPVHRKMERERGEGQGEDKNRAGQSGVCLFVVF